MQALQRDVEQLRQEVQEVKTILSRIEGTLVVQSTTMRAAQRSAENMDRHIGFVEGIWDRIRMPFLSTMRLAGSWVPTVDGSLRDQQ